VLVSCQPFADVIGYMGVELQLHTFLTWALRGGDGQLHFRLDGWGDLRDNSDIMV